MAGEQEQLDLGTQQQNQAGVTGEEAPPATEETVTSEGETKEQAPAKTFTQEDVDGIVQREKAKAEARAERRALKVYRETLERLIPQQVQRQGAEITRPKPEDFTTTDAYIEALADWKYSEREKARNEQVTKERNTSLAARSEALYTEAGKVAGFDREAFDALPFTQTIASAVMESDVAPKLMAYMSSNPDEVARIAHLSPARQAAEIGRLEAKLTAEPPAPKPSAAPAPIKPVTATAGGEKNPSEMTDAEFAAWRDKFRKARR